MSTIQLKNSTVAGKVPLPADLIAGELALNSADGKAYMKLDNGTVKELGGSGPTPPPIIPWVRNPTWLPMPPTTAAMEQVDMLVCVYPESNYFALGCTCVGGYTVDWGDGTTPENIASASLAQYLYDYNAAGLAGTNGPVTFTDSTDTVNRTAHGYTDGMTISFAEIISTTGIVQLQTYYVINATADTFQLTATKGGTVLPLTTDGTGAILPYKQAMVKMTPTTAGNSMTTVTLNSKNTTLNLQAYSQPLLDVTISAACNTLNIGGTLGTLAIPKLMERCVLIRTGSTSGSGLFQTCTSLQSVSWLSAGSSQLIAISMFNGCTSLRIAPQLPSPVQSTGGTVATDGMFNGCTSLKSVPAYTTTANTLNSGFMFNGCTSLETVPLFDTSKCTRIASMFAGCTSLKSVPAFNFSSAATAATSIFSGCSSLTDVGMITLPNTGSIASMFAGCTSLQTVPLFNLNNITDISNMFATCRSLVDVPPFNTQNVTTMTSMFQTCTSLQTVPFFNTVKVTTFSSMFNGCINIGSIPAFDTSATTGSAAFTNMFNGCVSLQQIPDMNFGRVAITGAASYTSMFSNCPSLSRLNLSPGNGPRLTFSVGSCKLSATALNQLYTSLPTVSGQTITVASNPGIAGDDPTIATAKGWSVVGS